MSPPPGLVCSVCGAVFSRPVLLPCCLTPACRVCALQQLLKNSRKCWIKSTSECDGRLTVNQLKPAEELRVLVTDFKGGGKLFKDKEETKNTVPPNSRPSERLVNTLIQDEKCSDDNLRERFAAFKDAGLVVEGGVLSVADPPELEDVVKPAPSGVPSASLLSSPNAPPLSAEEADDEEYSELQIHNGDKTPSSVIGQQNMDTEEEYSEYSEGAVAAPSSSNIHDDEEEYGECVPGSEQEPVHVKKERVDSGLITSVKIEKLDTCHDHFSAPNSVESNFSGDFDQFPSPKKEPGLSTPTSSGYWSDDAKEGPYFGKIQWVDASKTDGFVTVILDDGDQKHVHVSGYDVKCGAETGDLVEFVLGDDTQHGRAAKRVKLVEKGLPLSEEEQIKAQFPLKRSLEISVGWKQEGDSSKKLRTDEIIDVRAGMTNLSDYSDIADVEDEVAATVKTEAAQDEVMDEDLYDHCICDKQIMSRCQMCPFYFLESKTELSLLENESATFLAKIQGNEGANKRELKYLRHLPYPFRFLSQSKFQLLKEIGRNSLVAKISPVYRDHVFLTLQNPASGQITVKTGDILGICQESRLAPARVSHPLMNEAPGQQQAANIPVFIKKSDFTCDDNNVYCGFASLGRGKIDYKNCLMKVSLRPEYEKKFKLVKSHLTVQIKNSIWMEMECGRGVFERTHLKDGCIGVASSIMDDIGVQYLLSKIPTNQIRSMRIDSNDDSNVENNQEVENAYDEMLSQIDNDMKVNTVSPRKTLKHVESLLDRTYKGVVGVDVLDIPPKGEIETYLYLQDDDLHLDLKSLLKFRARVTNNEEFKYYNNCYDVEEQYLTIVNGVCRTSRSTRPCVKVKITNPRSDLAILRKDSPLALIKVHMEDTSPKVGVAPAVAAPPPPITKLSVTQYLHAKHSEVVKTPTPAATAPQKDFNAVKFLEKRQKKFIRKWDSICAEGAFYKSLMVEDKYPYFTSTPRPKVPFNVKGSNDLNMRVGINQDSKPIRVVDKINGVFTCTICDVVILDRYSLQDHWYSVKHKNNMKQVQVIAGLEERIAMNRPVLQEMVDQFTLCPLLGLDYVVEILAGHLEPSYHCAVCSVDITMSDLMHHLTSLNHVLTFIKEFFEVAWARFSTITDFSTWLNSDFECLDIVVNKIDQVHGRKKPSVVVNKSELGETVQRLRLNSYSARRTELDTFFRKNLTPVEPRKSVLKPAAVATKSNKPRKVTVRGGVTTEPVELLPKDTLTLDLKILDIPNDFESMNFVKVSRNPSYNGPCHIRPSFSRTWNETPNVMVKAIVVNTLNFKTSIVTGTDIGVITWSK